MKNYIKILNNIKTTQQIIFIKLSYYVPALRDARLMTDKDMLITHETYQEFKEFLMPYINRGINPNLFLLGLKELREKYDILENLDIFKKVYKLKLKRVMNEAETQEFYNYCDNHLEVMWYYDSL